MTKGKSKGSIAVDRAAEAVGHALVLSRVQSILYRHSIHIRLRKRARHWSRDRKPWPPWHPKPGQAPPR